MRGRDVVIAVAVVIIWGVNFVAIDVGLGDLPPLFFVALRFLLTAIPAVFLVPRPGVGWRAVLALGLLMCVGQFGLLFVAMSSGMPAGLAASSSRARPCSPRSLPQCCCASGRAGSRLPA
jgi:O-acetylserine/cysteine efflux transporter